MKDLLTLQLGLETAVVAEDYYPYQLVFNWSIRLSTRIGTLFLQMPSVSSSMQNNIFRLVTDKYNQ